MLKFREGPLKQCSLAIMRWLVFLCTQVKEQKGNYDEYIIRHLKATCRGETREVTHLHYMEFPDRGTPKCVPSLLDMIELMRELQPANFPEAPPVIVHCRPVHWNINIMRSRL